MTTTDEMGDNAIDAETSPSVSQAEVNNPTVGIPIPAVRTKVGQAEQTEGMEEKQPGDSDWITPKKRGHTSRRDEAAANGSDSSEPETPKVRLLEKQSQHTRSRSQRKHSK